MSNVKEDFFAPKSKEKFDPKRFFIIVSIHFLSLGCFFYNSLQSVLMLVLLHYFFTFFGVTLGLHRYFSHRLFKLSRFSENILGLIATLCFQGGPLLWASSHRVHHRYTDSFGDPHSAERGFWWSHLLWLFYKCPNGLSYRQSLKLVKDLQNNNFLKWLENNAITLNISFIAFSFALCLLTSRLEIFFWAVPLRIVTVWHATWSINSFAHGVSPFNDNLKMRDSVLISLILPAEGFHKSHHSYPRKLHYSEGKDFTEKLLPSTGKKNA